MHTQQRWRGTGRQRRGARAGLLAALATGAALGCGEAPKHGGIGSVGPGPGSTSDGGAAVSTPCSDLFAQDIVRTYAVDIGADEWGKLVAEFQDQASLLTGVDFATYHPVTLHLDGETVTDASIKLRGQSSWLQTVMQDGDRAKMQFVISFEEQNPGGKFHDVDKLLFDMPRSDWTFMHNRLAATWLREIGIMAPCSASGKLVINGSYYGLFVTMENVGKRVIKEFFPSTPDGDLWKGGRQPKNNETTADFHRKAAFWAAATNLHEITELIDMDGSIRSWAAEAILNNADGYYGGMHNFYLYDQGAKGMLFLPQDTDATFDWLEVFDLPAANDHPVFWWEQRAFPAPPPGPHWVTVLSDSTWRKRYAEAIAALLAKWDVGQLQSRIDTWAAQIAPDMAADPHTWATPDQFNATVASARQMVSDRAQVLQSFVDCEKSGGPDGDGDGFAWCDDCRDDDPSAHLGGQETCGNQLDDNCNGQVDEGCAPAIAPSR